MTPDKEAPMQDTKARETTFEGRLGRIGHHLDDALRKVREAHDRAEINRRAEEVKSFFEREVARIDRRVAALSAQLKQDAAWTREDFAGAVKDELDVWRARLDELRVQEALVEMEARGLFHVALEKVERAYDQSEAQLEDLSLANLTDWSDIRKYVERSLGTLRNEIEDAEKGFGIA
jgi:exonuclease VII large subunit